MKILSLVWFKVLPARFGGQKGTAQFNRYLAEEVPLVCLCASDNVADSPLPYKLRPELPPGKRSVVAPHVWKQIRAVTAEERPTHLLLEYPYHAFAAVRAARRFGLKLVLHEHNIEYRRFRALGHAGWRLLRAYERWACRRADLVLFKTEADRSHAVEVFGIAPAQTLLVPYGIDPPGPQTSGDEIRRQWGVPDNARLFLFAGTLDYAPNAEAVQALYQEVAPRLDASGIPYRILICGRNRSEPFQHLAALRHPSVVQTGEVPDIAPYYAAADLFVNPVLSGGGVQTKIIDALAHNRPCVCFSFATCGIDRAACGPALLPVADNDWDGFVDTLLRTAGAPPAVPSTFLELYSWDRIAKSTAAALLRL